MVRKMTPDKIAGFTVALLTDDAKDVTGQIFGVRMNEIVLYSQPRPIRTIHNAAGWTPEDCVKNRASCPASVDVPARPVGGRIQLGSDLIPVSARARKRRARKREARKRQGQPRRAACRSSTETDLSEHGITSVGVYVPQLRLDRRVIAEAHNWAFATSLPRRRATRPFVTGTKMR